MFRALRLGIMSLAVAVLFGILGPAVGVRAADLATQYTAINSSGTSSVGIIFAGICSGPAPTNGSPDTCDCRAHGNCTLENLLQVFVNLSTFILGISGTAVLFVFVYGGFKWVFSRGDTKWVTEGKDAITASIIGLCIIFGAYVAINFIVSGLTTKGGAVPASTNLETTVNQSVTNGTGTTGVFTTE